MKQQLTQKGIERLPKVTDPTGRGRGQRFYDKQLQGFGCEKFPSGRIVFFVQYGARDYRRRVTIGRYGEMTPTEARKCAQTMLANIREGRDPQAEKNKRRDMLTFREFIEGKKDASNEKLGGYLAEIEKRKKDPRHDRQYLKQTADGWGNKRAGWANKRLDAISQSDVKLMRSQIIKRIELDRADSGEEMIGHTTANRWLASVRSCLHAAVADGLIASNPAAGIEPYRERPPRERTLSRDELGRVLKAIDAEPDPHVRAAFLLLIETGARKSEMLSARWQDLDFEGGTWRIPSPKAGNPQTIPLSSSAASMLRKLPRVGEYVVPGRDPRKHRVDLKKPWDRIRAKAKVINVN